MLPRLMFVILSIASLFASYSYVTNWLSERLERRIELKDDRLTYDAQLKIDSIVTQDERGAKHFVGQLFSSTLDGAGIRHLKISWYPPYNPAKRLAWQAEADKLQVGQIIQVTLTQRAFRNFYNPGGFDYEAHMLSRNLDGRAYLRQVEIVGQTESSWFEKIKYSLALHRQKNIERYSVDPASNQNTSFAQHLIPALVFGESSSIPPALMNKLQALGGIHLVVVSGLHMGLMLMFVWVGLRAFQRLFIYIIVRYRYQLSTTKALLIHKKKPTFSMLAPVILVLALAAYLLMSGMGISAQRAWIMMAVVLLLSLFQIRPKPLQGFMAAVVLVLIVNPLSIIQLGFLFSFSCVAILLIAFMGRKSWMQAWWRPQLIVFSMSGVLLSLFAMPFSLAQLLFNFLAVPVMAFFLLPMALLLSVIEWHWLADVFNSIFQLLMDWGAWLMAIDALKLSIALPLAGLELWHFSVLAGCLGLFWLPRIFMGQWIALILFFAVFLSSFYQSMNETKRNTQIAMWDVGQGLSIWLGSYDDHNQPWNFLYDTGNEFSPRFNLGSAVVAPALRSVGVRSLQQVVISHDDKDHAAGLSGIQQWFDIDQLHVGQAISGMEVKRSAHVKNCHTFGADWQRVSQVLSWRYLHYLNYLEQRYDLNKLSDNDQSCVMQLRYQPTRNHDLELDANKEITILITGDIEKRAEKALVELYSGQLQSDVLISPHHGSKSSSSLIFLQQVRPQLVLVSAGFNNRFHHPHPAVTGRYDEMGVRWMNTAEHGALILDLERLVEDKSLGRPLTIERGYELQKSIWRQESLTKK